MYKIDHPVFRDVEFADKETVVNLAKRFVEWAVRRDSEIQESTIGIIKFMLPTESGNKLPGWFWVCNVECRINATVNERL